MLSSTINGNIVIVLNSVLGFDLNEREEIFCRNISCFAKETKVFMPSDEIIVSIMQALLSSEKVAMQIILPREKGINYGKQIYEFKQRIIGYLKKIDINLNADEVCIDFKNEQQVRDLISNATKNERGSRNPINYSSQEPSKSEFSAGREVSEYDYEAKSKQFTPTEPLYSFERVIISNEIKEKITEAIGILECENKVFNEWGLYEIQPHPSTALSFYGPSGTGKTMAAEAIAKKLGKRILRVSYADVESKYHGEGPKMVKAIFLAAKKEQAVLFFDEADSLLSKRLTDVTSGSDQAINSMRSQLLICLEEYRGIVIFATNLVVNYDKAFLTRLISIEFKIPDVETRKKIWDVHIRPADDGKPHSLNIPLSNDIDTAKLAENFEFVGREIRNAVVSACVNSALHSKNVVTQEDFINACSKLIAEKEALFKSQHSELSSKENDSFKSAIFEKIKENK